MKYLKIICLSTFIGLIIGCLICLLVSFLIWDVKVLNEILIPIRICGTFGFLVGNIKYFTEL